MKRKSIFFLIIFVLLISCKSNSIDNQALTLIPQPNRMEIKSGKLDISGGFNWQAHEHISENLKTLAKAYPLNINDDGVPLKLFLEENNDENRSFESYKLNIDKKGISIASPSETGIFYGLQTLFQLLNLNEETAATLPCLEISDSPRFEYRGMMLDCSRHFLTMDFLKKQIDMMAYLKLNRFHWHLTDGTGWRLKINQYPELTDIAAWKPQAVWKDWWNADRQYVSEGTPGAYGGYYTQEEARELVAYAADRFITVIPEIEMPGHSEEVLAVYPQLSCTGKPYTSSEFCIGNPETYTFLENVLSEVIEIFSSEYIHIGGDEASREHWKKCPKCQALMKKEGFTEEAQLQSHLIKHIEQFLNQKGRRVIGWDEILEGGLAPDATVMSWRGEAGGITAAQSGHDAIMTPGSHCYFDSYQGLPDTQPEAIGGFLPIEKVYSYDPVPENLTAEEAKHILGPQANLWAEYIPSENHMEYMIYPRLLALAEVAWTKPENKSWNVFKIKVNKFIPWLQNKGYNTYTLSKEPFMELSSNDENNSIDVTLTTERYPAAIKYTIDGSNPDNNSAVYQSPISVKDSANIKAQLFQNGEPTGRIVEKRIDYHHGIGKKAIYITPFSRYYTAGGETALIDGIPGGLSHGDGHWQGFNLPEVEIVIDMGERTTFQSVKTAFMQNDGAMIWFPKTVQFLVSDDNVSYSELITSTNNTDPKAEGTLFENFIWQGDAAGRYLKMKADRKNGIGGWLFIDEIVVW